MNNIFTEDNKVWIFTREKDGSLPTPEPITDYKPYFYIKDEKGVYVSIFGDRLRKLTFKDPDKDLKGKRKALRESGIPTFEADITWANRCLIDFFSAEEPDLSEPFRYHFVDIETRFAEGGIDKAVREAVSPILSIGCYDSMVGYRVFCWREGHNVDGDIVKCFETEKEMVNAYLSFLKENFPDAIVGWNAARFDFPYMFTRFGDERWANTSPISRFTKCVVPETPEEAATNKKKWSNKGTHIAWKLAGTTFMDYMDLYKMLASISGAGLDSYSLDNVAKKELDIAKISFDLKKMEEVPLEELIAYNLRDVEIMVKLEEKKGILRFFNQARKVARSELDTVLNSSRMVDNLMLHYARINKYVLPSKNREITHDKFEGAYVKEPVPGLYDWVAVYDFASLYPNIMLTFNMSPETITDDPTNAIRVNNLLFSSETKGLYPTVCKDFMEARDRVKKEIKKHAVGSSKRTMLEAEYAALKVMTNSIYGYSAFPGARLYSSEVGSSITYIGREMIQYIEKHAGIEILYADTDSVFVKLPVKNSVEAMDEVKRISKRIKEVVDEFVASFGLKTHTFEMAFEKLYQRIFLGAKKRYVGWLVYKGETCDSTEIRGYETRRSDTPLLAKDFLNKFYRELVRGKSRDELYGMADEFKKQILTASPEEIGFPVTVKPPSAYSVIPIHLRAVQNSISIGLLDESAYGDKVKYIFVKRTEREQEDFKVLAFTDENMFLASKFEIDRNRVIERLVDMKITPIMELLFKPDIQQAQIW
jgi:DNA polymerase I